MNKQIQKRKLSCSFSDLDQFITSERESQKFIEELLGEPKLFSLNNSSDRFKVSQERAQHSVITYLMGAVFAEFSSIYQEIPIIDTHSNDANTCWIITALNHDYGYYSRYLSDKSVDYEKAFPYFLLTDKDKTNGELACLNGYYDKYTQSFAYTYDEILAYDGYAREYHNRDNNKNNKKTQQSAESVDHGILGGMETFNRLTRKGELSYDELITIKHCALAIAQHNIYKSNSKDRDIKYPPILREKLSHNSSFRITKNTPLLLYLCLIDTLECVKRLGRGEANGSYLQTKTVLKSIFVHLEKDCISIDLTQLYSRVEKKHDDFLMKEYKRYVDGVLTLGTWTCFEASLNNSNDHVIDIRLNDIPRYKMNPGNEVA